MIIEHEQQGDFPEIDTLIRTAFAHAPHRDGTEQDLVANLRKSAAYVPELALIARLDGRIIGHILFTEVCIGGRTGLALAPLSVLPAHQRQGVGKALMAAGHALATEKGYPVSVVLGSETYYPLAGYVPAAQFGITAPFDARGENFMARRLGTMQVPQGTVQYDGAFFGT